MIIARSSGSLRANVLVFRAAQTRSASVKMEVRLMNPETEERERMENDRVIYWGS